MTEVEKMFHDDIREKKSIKNSANKTNRTGKGPIRFPSDYLSKKEKEKLNGECSTWNLNGFYSWDEFKRMPDDIKISWLNRMLNVYGVGITTIEVTVFNKKSRILHNWLKDHPEIKMYINMPGRGGRLSKIAVEKFEKAVENWKNTQITMSEPVIMEEPPVEKSEPEGFSDAEKEFISRYLAPISEPKQVETKTENMTNPNEELFGECTIPERPRMSNMEFGMDGFDFDFLELIAHRFGGQKVHVCVSVYVEKSIDE